MNTNAHELANQIDRAAKAYRLSSQDLTGPRRDVMACAARNEVIAWARDNGFSLSFLGRYFERDHTSILNAERRHAKQQDYRIFFKSTRATQ